MWAVACSCNRRLYYYYQRTLDDDETAGLDLDPFNRAQLNRSAQGLRLTLVEPAATSLFPVELSWGIPWPRHVLQSLVGGGWAAAVSTAVDESFLQQCGDPHWDRVLLLVFVLVSVNSEEDENG